MFENWLECVKDGLEEYGITVEDCTDDTQLIDAFSNGDRPEEFVEYIAEKYDLEVVEGAGDWG